MSGCCKKPSMPTGNHILYEYAKDNPQLYTHDDPGLGLPAIFDRNRNATQLYIRRIYYGNLPNPLLDETRECRSPIPTARPSGICATDGAMPSKWSSITAIGTSPRNSPIPTRRLQEQQELFGPDPSMSAEHNPVPIRDDRFSSFRAGFEIRTLRRCRRVLMFHHFAELGGPTLVRSTDFTYHNDPDTLLPS